MCHSLECLGIAALVLAAPAVRAAQNPAVVGSWDPPFPLPLIAIHSAVLPTGKVLLFSAEHGVPGIHGWILEPSTLALTNVDPPAPWNPDCAGHSFLSDGRLLVAGGTLSFTPLTGSKLAFLFDPYSEQWVQVEDMAAGRWYPTNVTLEDGRVITMAGLSEVPSTDNPDIERWDPRSTSNWELLGQKSLPYYPLLHLMPYGVVFMAGPSAQTETYYPATNSWSVIDTTNFPGRYEACSVLLPPSLWRVMLIGGYSQSGSGQPTNSAEIIDLASSQPQWAVTAHMTYPRMEHNAVILPNGKVLVVGGRSDNDSTPTPVLTPEVYDPATSTWSSVAPHSIPRRYHSTAILLPDGRVLAAGGDYQASGEIYSPAYLFNGPRPAIVASPATVAYGSTFTIQFTGTTSTHAAVLISLSCVTHSNNMSQRYVSLGTIASAGGAVSLTAPADGGIAPPGFYMLFVVSSTGVPSVARMVRVLEPASGQAICFGDGSATACPCGNASPAGNQEGCLNSFGQGGSLFATGDASLSADTVTLSVSRIPPTATVLYFQGTATPNGGLGAVFGDGLRCASGSIRRLATKVGGFSQYPVAGELSLSVKGGIPSPGTWVYQAWYRDPTSFCTPATFNLTNAWQLDWGP